MPAYTEKRRAHLQRLNGLPQTIAMQFKPGRVAHNKTERLEATCDNCKKPILLTPWRFSRSKKHFCGIDCARSGKEASVTDQVVALYNSGMKIREIAAKMGHTIGTAAALLYKSKLKRLHPRIGHGRASVRSKLPKSCELCGYSRVVEVAHILPSRLGGKLSLENCYSLCPNCHHLFDHNLLTQNEQDKLKEIHASRSL